MTDMESYRVAILLLMFMWGFNGFALCAPGPTSRLLEVYVLAPLCLGLVLLLDSVTFDVLRVPTQAIWFWLWGVQ